MRRTSDDHPTAESRGDPASTPAETDGDLVEAPSDRPDEATRFLGSPHYPRRRGPAPGSVPGSMVIPDDSPRPTIEVMVYDAERASVHTRVQIEDLPSLLPREGGTAWIDVEGFGDQATLSRIAEILEIHPLAMADVVHVPQRPKIELYEDRLLVILQMARIDDHGEIVIEQVGAVLGPGWVVTFQERPGDVFDPVRERIRTDRTRIRREGADYLAYALIDAVIDGYFPVMDVVSDAIDALEEEVIQHASRQTLGRVHATSRTLTMLHRVQSRQRDAVASMLRDEDLPFSPALKPYLRDVHDHTFQILDAIETAREVVVGLMNLYLSGLSVRQNEVMKTLTIVATIFIPLTFATGVFGMNFEYMPELRLRWAYPAFWVGIGVLVVSLLVWFRRRGWLGDIDER